MNKLIFVESIQIGKFSFQGYVVDKRNNILSYAIFVNNLESPLLELVADSQRNVSLYVNNEMLNFINSNKTPDKRKRLEYFKLFYNFIIASEKKASYMVFKKQKLNYIKNSAEIIDIKNKYIND